MPFRIVRNDIVKMNTDAIVNTANRAPMPGPGCDAAVYQAAGYEEMLAAREAIGGLEYGQAAITPGFALPTRYVIHAVSPLYIDGEQGEEELLRNCYRNSLRLALENGLHSIAFPLISTGSFGYPKEEGLQIAVEEIKAFPGAEDLEIFLVVFDEQATELGRRIAPDLKQYIDRNYVELRKNEEYGKGDSGFGIPKENCVSMAPLPQPMPKASLARAKEAPAPNAAKREKKGFGLFATGRAAKSAGKNLGNTESAELSNFGESIEIPEASMEEVSCCEEPLEFSFDTVEEEEDFEEQHLPALEERMRHLSDTFSEYLLYLIEAKGMTNAEVYKRGLVDKKAFSKLKNNPDYHPQKLTALCLCMGAKLNLDETRDLLARAGYALSPCEKTDIIFSYFIEHKIYDMVELDIQLEEHGLPCIIA